MINPAGRNVNSDNRIQNEIEEFYQKLLEKYGIRKINFKITCCTVENSAGLSFIQANLFPVKKKGITGKSGGEFL